MTRVYSDPSCNIQDNYIALHMACVYGRKPFFLEEDNKDVTLLHIACHFGIVHYLITEMRCIPRYDVTQNQDLHCACLGGNLEVVKV